MPAELHICCIYLLSNKKQMWKHFQVYIKKYVLFFPPFPSKFLLWDNFRFSFSGGSLVKNLPANVGDVDLIPGPARFPEEGNGNHSSILAWEIPWTEESGGLHSVGSQRVGHDSVTKQQQLVSSQNEYLLIQNRKIFIVTLFWSYFLLEKLGRHHFDQVVKESIASNGTNQNWESSEYSVTWVVFLPNTNTPKPKEAPPKLWSSEVLRSWKSNKDWGNIFD